MRRQLIACWLLASLSTQKLSNNHRKSWETLAVHKLGVAILQGTEKLIRTRNPTPFRMRQSKYQIRVIGKLWLSNLWNLSLRIWILL